MTTDQISRSQQAVTAIDSGVRKMREAVELLRGVNEFEAERHMLYECQIRIGSVRDDVHESLFFEINRLLREGVE